MQSHQRAVLRARAKGDERVLSSHLDAFRACCGRYPSAQEGLGALVNPPSRVAGWSGVRSVPLLDPWGRPYAYVPPPTTESAAYQVISAGPDGTLNTADDVAGTGPDITVQPD